MAMYPGLSDVVTSYLAIAVFSLLLLYPLAIVVYNLYFHPLSKFKGPPFWGATRLGFINSLIRGNLVRDVRDIHEKYGDVVRLAPDELSFAREDTWHDVYTKRAGHQQFLKNPVFFKAPPGQPENMVTTLNIENHARMRRLLAPAFTEQAVMKQEPIVQAHSDLLIRQLKCVVTDQDKSAEKNQDTGAVVDIVRWYNFCTFDTIGDLGFGESFDSLKNAEYHPWVALIFNFLKGMELCVSDICKFADCRGLCSGMTLAAATRYYPSLETGLLQFLPAKIKKMQRDHYQVALDKIHRRMNLEKERDDFMTPVLKENPNFEKMSLEEIESTFSLLIVAGSETTATVLSGITNELLKAPRELLKLVGEVRSAFQSQAEITFEALRTLPFLNAVCQEGFRICNPIPAGLPRLVPKGGGFVCGHFLPEYTHVTVNPTAIAFSEANFRRAEKFLPDRFLPQHLRPAEFDGDIRSNQHPFSLGSRSCLGKPLAMAQIGLILAKMVWSFDIEAVSGRTLDWMTQKTFIVVEKKPVKVRLRMRQDGSIWIIDAAVRTGMS
ncbi:Versicolorin B desaturase [Lachnellula suecica]|uniref:Versicolorin B desaturase n=1 Tax=Lachnellula suecica TaxID=602035 RepID=A0A8T9C3M4_9HELO|nr:Versicolorin B desaturase [Lachnellula suecica]